MTKTHKGVHTEFARLAMNEPAFDVELRRFLPRAYDLKAICDYGVGLEAVVPLEKAASAVNNAQRFGLSCRACWGASVFVVTTGGSSSVGTPMAVASREFPGDRTSLLAISDGIVDAAHLQCV